MTDDVANRRLKALLEQIVDEDRRRPRARVAARVGLSESLVSKILKGTRSAPSSTTLAHVVEQLGLDPAYFFDQPELDPEPRYRDYLRTRVARGEPPGWTAFREGWSDFGKLTPHERTALRGLISSDHTVQRWTDWVQVAEWLVAHRR